MKPADDPAAHRKALFDGSTVARAEIATTRKDAGERLAESFAIGVINGAVESLAAHHGEEAAIKALREIHDRLSPQRDSGAPP